MRRPIVLVLGSAIALTAAAPAAAAEVEIKALDVSSSPRAAGNPGWDKEDVTILPGDSVRWTFAGTQLPHNVASRSSNWNVKTPYDNPGTTVKFDTPGRYEFFCDVHGNSMWGTVVVGEPPPPPLSEQPFPNDLTDAGVLETGGLDTTKPTVGSVRVRRSGRAARVRLRVSERSRVTVKLKRGSKTVKTKRASGSGSLRVTVGTRKLRAGRYRIEIRAVDVAGNAARLRTARLTLR